MILNKHFWVLFGFAVAGCQGSIGDSEENEKMYSPAEGIKILEKGQEDPAIQYYAALVDLETQGIKVEATAPTDEFRTVKDWAKATEADVAINADFMGFDDGAPFLYGDAVGKGERWPAHQSGRDSTFAEEWFFGNYGWVAFGEYGVKYRDTEATRNQGGSGASWKPDEETSDIPENTQALISGFPQIVVDGEPHKCDEPDEPGCFPDRSDMSERHPRTAIGLNEDRDTLILAVVDGRSDESVGMYGTELADLMHELGAWTAFNLDGGASSQMYVKGEGVINFPSTVDHREVLNHLGVISRDLEERF